MSTSTAVYRVPEPMQVENEGVFARSAEESWARLVEQLSKSYFVINNIDKESRLINLSFSTDVPAEYITGGLMRRVYERGDDRQEFEYDPAASSSYLLAGRWGRNLGFPSRATIHRKSQLEGRVNIFLAPQDGGTKVTVNVRFVLTVSRSGNYVSWDGLGRIADQGTLLPETQSVSFTTNQPCTVDWGTPQEPLAVSFRSRGRLEGEILALVR